MDNYARMTRGKLSSTKALEDAYKHNERIYQVENADPLRQHLNIELVPTNGKTYNEIFDEQIANLKIAGVKSKAIRKDAVLGFELVFGYSREREGTIDVDDWAKTTLDWVRENYNPPNGEVTFIDETTGKEKKINVDNIKHAIVHRDESNTHLHVFVVPIDPKGHLNSSYYNRNRRQLIEQQTSYAKAMEKFGLERGEAHTTAKAENIAKYYNNINKAVLAQLPEPYIGETAHDYRIRANEVLQIEKSHHNNDVVKLNQQLIHERSLNASYAERENAQKRSVDVQLTRLCGALGVKEIDDAVVRELVDTVEENKRFKKAISDFPIRSAAEDALKAYNNMLLWQMEQERKERLKEEKR